MKGILKRFLLQFVLFCCLLAVLVAIPIQAEGGIIYVTPNGGGNGTSWESPMTLDEAWNAASPGTKLFLSAGTYNRTTTLILKEGVELYGGFPGSCSTELLNRFFGLTQSLDDDRPKHDRDNNGIVEPWEFANETVITGNVRLFAGAANISCVIDGVTLTTTASTTNGAAIQLYPGNVLRNSVVTGCNNAGRGVILVDGGQLLSCYVHNNKSNSDRGCICVYYNNKPHPSTISHCRIENNTAQYGGGIYSRAGENCEVIHNT